ncbi:hypothetical protein C8Q76DRAFT_803530 [Earliella scabrosa]|nr:hypothetical protein C8Q76DRAFT_803530 [Earliella scabrosa]
MSSPDAMEVESALLANKVSTPAEQLAKADWQKDDDRMSVVQPSNTRPSNATPSSPPEDSTPIESPSPAPKTACFAALGVAARMPHGLQKITNRRVPVNMGKTLSREDATMTLPFMPDIPPPAPHQVSALLRKKTPPPPPPPPSATSAPPALQVLSPAWKRDPEVATPSCYQYPEDGFSINGTNSQPASFIGEGIADADYGQNFDDYVTDGLDRHGIPIPGKHPRKAQSLTDPAEIEARLRNKVDASGYTIRYNRPGTKAWAASRAWKNRENEPRPAPPPRPQLMGPDPHERFLDAMAAARAIADEAKRNAQAGITSAPRAGATTAADRIRAAFKGTRPEDKQRKIAPLPKRTEKRPSMVLLGTGKDNAADAPERAVKRTKVADGPAQPAPTSGEAGGQGEGNRSPAAVDGGPAPLPPAANKPARTYVEALTQDAPRERARTARQGTPVRSTGLRNLAALLQAPIVLSSNNAAANTQGGHAAGGLGAQNPALPAHQETAPGAKTHWTSAPQEGWAQVERDDPLAPYLNLEPSRAYDWQTQDEDKTVIIEPYFSSPPVADEIWEKSNALTEAITGITGVEDPHLIAPVIDPASAAQPGDQNQPGDPTRRVPTAWCLQDLDLATVNLLTGNGAGRVWSTPMATFRALPHRLVFPTFICALGDHGNVKPEAIESAIIGAFYAQEFYRITKPLLEDAAGLNGQDLQGAVDDVAKTARVVMRKLGDPGPLIANVYCNSPTDDVTAWRLWKDQVSRMDFSSPKVFPGRIRPPMICKGCQGVDHSTHQCPYPAAPGWNGVVPPRHFAAPKPAEEANASGAEAGGSGGGGGNPSTSGWQRAGKPPGRGAGPRGRGRKDIRGRGGGANGRGGARA